MSGSPIIQNGKLIGEVTHVPANDPIGGYGIFIENMLEVAEKANILALRETDVFVKVHKKENKNLLKNFEKRC